MSDTIVRWNKLIDGDPTSVGRYTVAHRGMSKTVIFYPINGWQEDISWATHWAEEVRAPHDGTPQLFRKESKVLRDDNINYRNWSSLSNHFQ